MIMIYLEKVDKIEHLKEVIFNIKCIITYHHLSYMDEWMDDHLISLLQTDFINDTEFIIDNDEVYKLLDSSTMSSSIEHYVE